MINAYIYTTPIKKQPEKIIVRVFIHGTLIAGCFFVDIPGSWNDSFQENSLIERAMASARKHSFLHHAELVLDAGLIDITKEIMVPLMHRLYDDRAAISIIRAFERTDNSIQKRDGTSMYRYYTFGWSGALSERKRNKDAEILYASLLNEKKRLLKKYPNSSIHFELFAYSHGGQLVAHLATLKKMRPHDNLTIDLAVLCGTPLYKEKIQPMISSSLFKKIINFYSYGDAVQTLDIISTPEHYCVKTFQDLHVPLARRTLCGPIIIDVSLHVHGNKKVFGHDTFFCCSLYRLPSYLKNRSAIKKTLNLFAPLPFISIAPTCLKTVNGLKSPTGFNKVDLNLTFQNKIFSVEATATSLDGKIILKKHSSHYTLQQLNKNFVAKYTQRASTSGFNHMKYTFYHIVNNF